MIHQKNCHRYSKSISSLGDNIMFKRLNIKDWRQFANIDIEFDSHLTILTGANGAGKTTILNLLSKSIGWTPEFVSSFKHSEKGTSKYFNSLSRIDKKSFIRKIKNVDREVSDKLGELEFNDGSIADLILPVNVTNGTYSIEIRQGKKGNKEMGVYVNSHRPSFPYRAVGSIPTFVYNRKKIYEIYNSFSKTFIFDTYRDHNKMSATSLIKETLASLAIFGYGNQSVAQNETAKALFEGYIDVLRIVLPPKLGFKKIFVDVPEVILCTETGNFPLDAVSGGISSIIDITWQLYMFEDVNSQFIALIDEPENHLHPELQRTFLGNLIKAFPNVQFIVATHNPFMITSQKESKVYVLNYDERHKVFSYQLDYVNRAGTSNAILREVLGIESTMPIWAENELNAIIKKYIQVTLSDDVISNLRKDLQSIGLDEYIPESISKIVEEIKSNDKTPKN